MEDGTIKTVKVGNREFEVISYDYFQESEYDLITNTLTYTDKNEEVDIFELYGENEITLLHTLEDPDYSIEIHISSEDFEPHCAIRAQRDLVTSSYVLSSYDLDELLLHSDAKIIQEFKNIIFSKLLNI